MPRPLSCLAVLILCTSLLACKDSPAPTSPNPTGNTDRSAAIQPVSFEAIAAEAKGFTVGSDMAVRRVFVFFDPQCPHCAALWRAAAPLKPQARFIWIPVGILNPASLEQGATLLAAPDPAAAMDEHETSLLARQGGITAQSGLDTQRAEVGRNTALMTRYGFGSVPVVVGKHAVTGELVVKEGALPTAVLATALGLQVPAGH